jgi:hypothetical protein
MGIVYIMELMGIIVVWVDTLLLMRVKSEREYFKYNYDMGVQDLDAKMPIDTILINEVRGHSIAFWTDIQHLHDFGEFYDDEINV